MNTTVIGIAAAAFVGWLLLAKKNAAENLQFFISSIDASFQGATPIIIVNVGIQNASNEQFNINSLVGSLTADGYLIGNVSSFTKVSLPAAGQAIYPLYVRVALLGTALEIYNLISTRNGLSKNLKFTGTINASGLVAPINLDYKIG